MTNKIIKKSLLTMLLKKEITECSISKCLILALEEYVNMGYKLSDLSWFRGLNFETLERE